MVAISAVVLVATLGIAVFFGLRARGGSTGTTTIPSARGEVSAMAGPTAGEVALPAITDTTTAIIPPTSPVAPIASATPTASPPHLAATHAPTAPRPAGTWGGARR